MTDGLAAYKKPGATFAEHHRVNHERGEYAYTSPSGRRVYNNSVESFFAQMKRSIDGTHHFVAKEHLERSRGEFDFWYGSREYSDTQRVQRLMGRLPGRVLTYDRLTGRR